MSVDAPIFFADFTTEGGTNHYWSNGAARSSFAAWLSAAGGTFTRAAVASYTNSSGNLAQALSGAARFDYDPIALTARGLLLEGVSTNIIVSSNSFTTAPWGNEGSTPASQNATGPDGVSNSAWTFTASGGSLAGSYIQTLTSTYAAPIAFSFYVKPGTATWAYICLGDNTGANFLGTFFNLSGAGSVGSQNVVLFGAQTWTTANPTITLVSGGWYRITLTVNTTTNPMKYALIGFADADASYNATAGKTGIVFGAQGETQSFTTSYIPTTTTPVTRPADNLNLPWTSTTFTGLIKTALLLEQDGNKILDAGSGLLTQAAGPLVSTSNGTQTLTASVNAWTSSNTIAISGSPTGRLISANGGVAVSDSNALVPSAPTIIQVGADTSDANNSFGNFSQFGFWDIAVTPNQLQEATGIAPNLDGASFPSWLPTLTLVTRNLTDTIDNLTNPVNCVLMGHQDPISKLMDLNKIGGPLKGVFGE